MNEKLYHKSVLVKEVVESLSPVAGAVYLDATFGGGGHTAAILEAEPGCKVIACDWDETAIDLNSARILEAFPGRVQFFWTSFGRLQKNLKKHNIARVDGIIADFGTSQYQLFQDEGFSFMRDTNLDMRMSPAHQHIKASTIVNRATESELAHIFWRYADERKAREIAYEIVKFRRRKKVTTTKMLADIVLNVVKRSESGQIHPATRVFQALRIVVNDELGEIRSLITQAARLISPGGRFVTISFHSLEDGTIKEAFRSSNGIWSMPRKKVIVPSPEEIRSNSSSRSARLRILVRE